MSELTQPFEGLPVYPYEQSDRERPPLTPEEDANLTELANIFANALNGTFDDLHTVIGQDDCFSDYAEAVRDELVDRLGVVAGVDLDAALTAAETRVKATIIASDLAAFGVKLPEGSQPLVFDGVTMRQLVGNSADGRSVTLTELEGIKLRVTNSKGEVSAEYCGRIFMIDMSAKPVAE